MTQEKIRKLVSKMTLEEKAGFCSGADFWHTKGIERLGIPSIMFSDGPHGLRKQEEKGDHLGMGESIPAVCFPAGCLSASSFDRDLLKIMGKTLGNECQAEGISVLLGPAMNIKRSPLCGRNFEYYSEDPYVSSELATAYIEGLQSENVGASPKHFVANNQEHYRLTSSSNMDERTLHEIYLASFESVIKQAKPWTVMASYNKLNGTYTTESKELLKKILRDDWKFDGFVMSDWGAVDERVPGLKAGMEVEMPGNGGVNDRKIVQAVKNGELEETMLDEAVYRFLTILYRYVEQRNENAVFDREADHEIARQIAEESMVLLKNEGVLPIKKEQKAAFIGHFAKEPRYQGGGSSHIHSSKVASAFEAAEGKYEVTFAQGFRENDDKPDVTLIEEAKAVAKEADVVVLFVGLPERYESEGYDRTHMRLPEAQNALVEAITEVHDNVVVVLHNGAPVELPWVDNVQGILESYLAGQAVGEAQVHILYGEVNPSGKLAESFPLCLEDNPTYPFYGREGQNTLYREGVLVGYRYYDTKKKEVLFPFGHGLSYTMFQYSDLQISTDGCKDTDYVKVKVSVQNTGDRLGKEVVQLYVAPKEDTIVRPVQELRAFTKVQLNAGEKKTVEFTLDAKAFSSWNTELHDWYVSTGDYEIRIGKSSREIVLSGNVHVEGTKKLPFTFTRNTPLGELFSHPEALQTVPQLFTGLSGGENAGEDLSNADNPEMVAASIRYSPLRSLCTFAGMDDEQLEDMLNNLNKNR